METLLIEGWLSGDDVVEIRDEASISVVRQKVRFCAAAQRLRPHDAERLATAASELGWNHLKHAIGGRMAVRPIEGGVEVIAADRGPGIADPTKALAGEPRVSGSLGVGIAAACELADAVDFDVRVGEGSCVWARKYVDGGQRRRQVGIFGRALAGQSENGDHARFARRGDEVVVGVCDGLGHGRPAREAANLAIAAFDGAVDRGPDAIIEACHAALGRTRGAVMAVARVGAGGAVSICSAGNVTVEAAGHRQARRFGGTSVVLGAPSRARLPPAESAVLEPRHNLVLFTDGISARASIAEDTDLLLRHPIVIAHQIAARFGRDNDDLLVCVVR